MQVTGIDFHDVDIPNLPDNVELINEDLNSRLTEFLPLDSFDLIQSRFVSNCIRKDHWAAYTLELVQYVTSSNRTNARSFPLLTAQSS